MSTGAEQPSLEQQLAELQAQLVQAQKLTALGELVSTTTHEFNNVLTTVINYAKMGIRHADAPTRDKAFEKILAAGQRAAKITNGILAFAKNRASGFEPTDVARIIQDSVELLDREMQKYRVTVDLQIEPAPPAWANGNQIQQILLNLLINARQAMPNGGRLWIKLAHDPAADLVEIVVRDTGTGIPADKLRRIFDPFFTTKEGPDASGKGGTGLGLSMCRSIIEAHRGKIRVESTPGKGTAFTIRLPVAKIATTAADSAASASSADERPAAVPAPARMARTAAAPAATPSAPVPPAGPAVIPLSTARAKR